MTVPPGDLAEILQRLLADAKGALAESGDERETREAEEASRQRHRIVLAASSELLIALQARERREA